MAIIAAGNTLILAFGGHQVISGQLSVGTLVAFYGYLLRLFEPLIIATDLQARGQRVAASIRRVLQILDHRVLPVERPLQKLAPPHPASLEFREVYFSYRKDRPLLRDLSFVIHAGEKVALVGLNGSGKSTIGQIAAGLYTPEQGLVLLNGKDTGTLTRGGLNAAISMVPQEPVIFAGTVKENLLYGDPHASDARILEAAKYAHLDQVVSRFPAGMEELLGPRGRRLSGGEKKRLALARAMLQQPEILILDEVTGALDEPVAYSLLRSLDQFRNGHTLVLISHRLATMQWADRILVVNDGTIADDGPHHQLENRSPVYRQILRCAKQAVTEI
jgi:ABC-type multidrug transport system fused ATPase/permease subunit